MPGEGDGQQRAVERRVREFRAGRLCARRATRMLGLEPTPVVRGPGRAPRWPAGLVSITHTGHGECGYAAAAGARKRDVLSLGIDVEVATPLVQELLDPVPIADEIEALAHCGPPAHGVLAKLAFAAKEAVYKCQYPLTGAFLGVDDVRVDLDPSGRRFFAVIRTGVASVIPAGTRWSGDCSLGHDFIMAAVLLPCRSESHDGDSL